MIRRRRSAEEISATAVATAFVLSSNDYYDSDDNDCDGNAFNHRPIKSHFSTSLNNNYNPYHYYQHQNHNHNHNHQHHQHHQHHHHLHHHHRHCQQQQQQQQQHRLGFFSTSSISSSAFSSTTYPSKPSSSSKTLSSSSSSSSLSLSLCSTLVVYFLIATMMPTSVQAALDFVLPKGYKNWGSCDIGTPFSTDKLTGAGAYMQIFTTMRASCDGYISEWWIYNVAKVPNAVLYLSVWQKLKSGPDQYFLVGFNTFSTNSVGWQKLEVPYEKRIKVRPGYMMGFHYETYNLDQDKLVVPHASDASVDIDLYDLHSVVAAPLGHATIMEEMDRNRFVWLPYGEIRNSRLPALLAHVIRDVNPMHLLSHGITQPRTTLYRSTSPTNGPDLETYPPTTASTTPSTTQRTTTLPSGTASPTCFLPRDNGDPNCDQSLTVRWYYDNEYSQRCQLFTFTGCGGNVNNYKSQMECILQCEREPPVAGGAGTASGGKK